MERVDPTTELDKILIWCSGQQATDLHNWSRVEMEMHGFARSAGGLLKPDPAR